jgi:hypothetical protein
LRAARAACALAPGDSGRIWRALAGDRESLVADRARERLSALEQDGAPVDTGGRFAQEARMD